MNSELITRENNSRIESFFSSLKRLASSFEGLFINRKSSLEGDIFYTDRELSKKLKLSRRTLQDYRNEGIIPYIKLGGKILYRGSEIEKLLLGNTQRAFRGDS